MAKSETVGSKWNKGFSQIIEHFAGVKPTETQIHLEENGLPKIPAVETQEGLRDYIQLHLMGIYDIDSRTATFPGKGTAEDALEVLRLMGYSRFEKDDPQR
jgi:hypothetical protein